MSVIDPSSPPAPDRRDSADLVPAHVPWRAVGAFAVLALGLGWLVASPLWLSGRGLQTPLAQVVIVAMMYTPGASALVVVRFLQRPRPGSLTRYLGISPLRPVGRLIAFSSAALVGSAALVAAGVVLLGALGLVRLDLVHFSGFAQTLSAAGARSPLPVGLLVLLQLLSIPIGALVNSVATIGEELGWRGWLLPSLRPLGLWPALIASGALWGLWHAPIILLGYDFLRPDALGVVLMVVACVLLGILFGWLRLRSGSIWPSVIAHGALNASAGLLPLLVAANTRVDPVVAGPLGMVTWIVFAVVIGVLLACGQLRPDRTPDRRGPGNRVSAPSAG